MQLEHTHTHTHLRSHSLAATPHTQLLLESVAAQRVLLLFMLTMVGALNGEGGCRRVLPVSDAHLNCLRHALKVITTSLVCGNCRRRDYAIMHDCPSNANANTNSAQQNAAIIQ